MCHVMMEYLFNGGFAVVEEQKAKEAISINQYLRKAGRYIKALHIVLTKPSTTMLANALCEDNKTLVYIHPNKSYFNGSFKKIKTSNQRGYFQTKLITYLFGVNTDVPVVLVIAYKLWIKQRIHRTCNGKSSNGSDQYIKNYYKMCHVMMEYLSNGKRKCILLILVDVVGVTTDVVGVTTYLNYSNYGIREWRNVLILVDVVVVTTYVNVHRCQEDDGRVQVNYGIREWRNVLILVDVVVTTYVNVHRCQEVDGRVQVLMVERPSSLKLRNKQQVHVCRNYGSDQYIKNYYTMCHPMMECLFNELKQSTMRKSSSRKKVLSLSRRNSSTPVTCALMPH